ncbi:MAG: integrase arm-type DNA-binding domain-containing protein [Proteobacteria bacterium]|nr:integrase arm-type DNA-binding domain-containing protein [Pseudomonadota bacterium]
MSIESRSRKTNITQSTIAGIPRLRTDGCVWVIRDTALIGFQIRVLPTGKAVYWIEARFGGGQGKNKKFQIGTVQDIPLVADARARARVARDKIRSGIDPLAEKRAQAHEGKSLRQLVDDYYACRDLKPRTKKHYEYLRGHYFKGWLDKRVADITLHEVRDWYLRIRGKPGDANGASRFLSSLMIYAISQEIIARNPCDVLTAGRMRRSLKARERHIESDDLGAFFKVIIDFKHVKDSEVVARDVILLIITTGLRSEEARALKWEDVDFRRGKIVIPDTKNNLPHTVPMTPLTYSMLLYRRELPLKLWCSAMGG